MNAYTNIADFMVIPSPARTVTVNVNGVDVEALSHDEWLAVAVYKTGERSLLGTFPREEKAVREVADHKARMLAMTEG